MTSREAIGKLRKEIKEREWVLSKPSVYLLMWQEAMSQIGENYPGEEVRERDRVVVCGGDFWIHFYDDKLISYSSEIAIINLFKLYKIWNDHEK